MGILKTIYDKVWNIIEAINLKQSEKLKLIELLLIIGSILIAFKEQPENMIDIFMIYLFFSIIYYIFIHNLKLDTGYNWFFNLIPLIIAASFSIMLNVNLFLSVGANALSKFPTFMAALYMLYYVVFSFIIYAALANLDEQS